MNTSQDDPFRKSIKSITTFYCIGDDGVNKNAIYQHFQLQSPQESQEIGISVKQTGDNQFVEIYDLPTDKMLRNSLQLYFGILPAPTLILYFLKIDSNSKEIRQWVKILRQTHLNSKIVFVAADVSTYLEREKIIVRIGKQFQASVLENICFVAIEPNSIERIVENVNSQVGIEVRSALCLLPTLKERLAEHFKEVICRVRSVFGNFRKKDDEKSIV